MIQVGRETFTSLKATRAAHRYASEILYAEPYEMPQECPECHRTIDRYLFDGEQYVCARCGLAVDPPAYILARQRDRHEELAHAQHISTDIAQAHADEERKEDRTIVWVTLILGGFFFLVALFAWMEKTYPMGK